MFLLLIQPTFKIVENVDLSITLLLWWLWLDVAFVNVGLVLLAYLAVRFVASMFTVSMKCLPTVLAAVYQATDVSSEMVLVTGVGDEMAMTRSARHPFFKPTFWCIETAPTAVWTNMGAAVRVPYFTAFAEVGLL